MRRLHDGGRIVSSNDLDEHGIAEAQACGRMAVDADGFGYVYLPKDAPAAEQFDLQRYGQLRQEIEQADHDHAYTLETTSRRILEMAGWRYTCKTPGSMWRWTRDGVYHSTSDALRAVDEQFGHLLDEPADLDD